MGILRSRNLMKRTKATENRVYVPADARDNQYIIAEIKINDLLIEQFSDKLLKPTTKELLNTLLHKIRRVALEHHVAHLALVASDRFIRVRYGVDNEVITTNEQHIFYYNPTQSAGLIGICPDDSDDITNLRLVCFATGDKIRENAANFHQNVLNLVHQLKSSFNFIESIKLQDHQHISFSTAKHSVSTQSKAHGFRIIEKRYKSSNVAIADKRNSKAFVIVKANFNQYLYDKVLNQQNSVTDMHLGIAKTLMQQAKKADIFNLAYIASEKYPVIKSDEKPVEKTEENTNSYHSLMTLNFDHNEQQMLSIIDDQYANSNAYLVFYINPQHIVKQGYASYINKLIKLLDKLAFELNLDEQDKAMLLRFYQHVSYFL